MSSPRTRLRRLWEWVRMYAQRPWFPPAIGSSAAVDYVFWGASPILLLGATTLLRTHGRWWVPVCFALWAAVGATAFTAGVQAAESVLFVQGATSLPGWLVVEIRRWGAYAIAVSCVLPLSLRSVVVVGALGGITASSMGLAVLAGRLVGFSLLVVVLVRASHTPLFRSGCVAPSLFPRGRPR